MDLNKLLIFARVAELQSFTKAAKELGIEKSTVSSKISELEENLGARLLNRTTRTVALTEAGEGYFHYCQQIVENAIEAEEFMQTFSAEPQGLLRISAPEGIGRILFKDLFNIFLKKYNKIELEVFLSGRAVDLVRERFDLAIRVSHSRLKDSSLVGKLIMEVEMGIFASAEYVAARAGLNKVEQIIEQPFISLGSLETTDLLKPAGKSKFPPFKTRITINDIEACIDAIHGGLGLGVLPVGAVQEELNRGSLVKVCPNFKIAPIYLYVLYPSRQWVSSKLKVFLEFLEEWAQKQNG
ncbi:MAG: hypothetical protein COA71_09095 [SAR86 cluster bacterium]|uniref:HTH lysR-type domain-containing protein n=1 Tax=SAR86 cluster bacterium TaxID=2030880 RepID=A0A2A5CCD7_9GAMM|nr:MAG: hypothetical protein COA71_09095 [SAR86 cluster bacterium]